MTTIGGVPTAGGAQAQFWGVLLLPTATLAGDQFCGHMARLAGTEYRKMLDPLVVFDW